MMPTNLFFIILLVHLPSAVSAFLLICVHHKLFLEDLLVFKPQIVLMMVILT